MKKHIKRTFANIDQGVREPRSIGPMVRASLIQLWRARGGGFYGLGYVLTFVALEVPAVIANFAEVLSGTASIAGAVFEWLLRLGTDTLVNMLQAFLWPALLLGELGNWGIAVLASGYLVFEKLLRPIAESAIPELKKEEDVKAETEEDENHGT